jgi:hypothetical protein
MALTNQQSERLYEVIRGRFPNDSPDQLGLRILRVAVNNNPSAAQKAILAAIVSDEVAARDSVLATYDATVTAQKTDLQTIRNEINNITGSL